ncbi:uncharacterized protein C4orf36 homolog [Fukomys damarensis]|uniref:uncharacterized protein C4orf36 homolog n=1 Tax=Fukomys damarensis TaxID=885580 RepID=UPI00053F7C37|nr:uncharacterized protein C4orf36 homolog [Fukomys damarensis]
MVEELATAPRERQGGWYSGSASAVRGAFSGSVSLGWGSRSPASLSPSLSLQGGAGALGMACGLPRRNTVRSILRGSCYSVQETWDLALLTKTWYSNLVNSRLPFLGEIAYGSPLELAKCGTKEGLLPSEEAIKLERDYEMKRLTKLKCQENALEEIQMSLRARKAGLRRPLQPQ